MIQPIGISFKSTYVDSSYRTMNEDKKVTVGNIIGALQSHVNSNGETTETLYEKKGIDFYITDGDLDEVNLYYAESYGGEIGSAKKVLIGSYSQENPFDTQHVNSRYKWRSTLNTVKKVVIAMLLGMFALGVIKSCKNKSVLDSFPQNTIAKK